MKAGEAIAEILKREGIDVIFGYPRNDVLEAAARVGIRPIIVRQERTGLHMADALSRLTSGEKMGVFAMQHGPGTENAFGGVAQAYGEAVPVLVLPQGYPRRIAYVRPTTTRSQHARRHQAGGADHTAREVPKSCGAPSPSSERPLRTGAGRDPGGCVRRGRAGAARLHAGELPRTAPDPEAVRAGRQALVAAKRPVIYAGQGVH